MELSQVMGIRLREDQLNSLKLTTILAIIISKDYTLYCHKRFFSYFSEYKGIVYAGFVLYGLMITTSLVLIPGVQLVSIYYRHSVDKD